VILTRAQREALYRVWMRIQADAQAHTPFERQRYAKSYMAFRRTVVPAFFDNVVMVPYAGMWLGIERDGYTHS
jgi:hypothetical protein